MPIKEFRCSKCGKEFEELVLKKDEEVCCPHCGGKELERLFSVFATRGLAKNVGSGRGCSSCKVTSCETCK